jgi:hypothetical protein
MWVAGNNVQIHGSCHRRPMIERERADDRLWPQPAVRGSAARCRHWRVTGDGRRMCWEEGVCSTRMVYTSTCSAISSSQARHRSRCQGIARCSSQRRHVGENPRAMRGSDRPIRCKVLLGPGAISQASCSTSRQSPENFFRQIIQQHPADWWSRQHRRSRAILNSVNLSSRVATASIGLPWEALCLAGACREK